MRLAASAALVIGLAGCQLYFNGSPPPPPPPDANAQPMDGGSPNLDDPACDAFVDCGPMMHCEPQCAPPGTANCVDRCHIACVPNVGCEDVDCGPGKSCVESCLHDCVGMAWYCTKQCVANGSAGSCTEPVVCAQPAVPACPSNTTPGVANGCYTGYCIPTADCASVDPGSCDAVNVTCMAAPPSCPAGTTPGVDGTCWSGYCIPDAECPCERLGTESSCAARADCAVISRGGGCTCIGSVICSCSDPDVSFERCRAK